MDMTVKAERIPLKGETLKVKICSTFREERVRIRQ